MIEEEVKVEKPKAVRVFVKEMSIFKPWKEDTEADLKACAKFDFKAWKLHRFVKDELDLETC